MSRSSAAGAVFIQVMNCAAAFLCLELAATAEDDPPQKPLKLSPAFHCGSGATAHLPLPLGALLDSTPGAHTADAHVSSLPLVRALFHSEVHWACVSTTPSLTRPPQKSATLAVAAS